MIQKLVSSAANTKALHERLKQEAEKLTQEKQNAKQSSTKTS